MRFPILAFLLPAVAFALPKPQETEVNPYGTWDVSMTYSSVNTGAYSRNVTTIYTNIPENIWQIIHCYKLEGPGVEPVDYCDNPSFRYTWEGSAGTFVSSSLFMINGESGSLERGRRRSEGRILLAYESCADIEIDIHIVQSIKLNEVDRMIEGDATLDVTCASQRSCWGRGFVEGSLAGV